MFVRFSVLSSVLPLASSFGMNYNGLMKGYILMLTPLLWIGEALVPGQAQGPATGPPGVTVTLGFPKPLHRVELRRGREAVGVGLEGCVEVTVVNRGPAGVTLYDLDVHGLCFRDVKTGVESVLVHPCDAAFYLGLEPPPPGWTRSRTHPLGPGESFKVRIEDFGCSGGFWAAPPPGEYQVVYRLRTAPPWELTPPHATPEENRFNPAHDIPAFRARLLSPEFWQDCPSSEPVPLLLKKPRLRYLK